PNLEVLVMTDQNRDAFLSRRRSLIDPWGRDYIYERPRPGVRGYRIITYGRDGVAGGEGADSDLDNWMIADGVR
ncbi:MAG: type II secretion system protein GspG, partial [Planctomycetes bacterium]|nr:type II secretion system protein GspG [Planctomycetota bacterium]